VLHKLFVILWHNFCSDCVVIEQLLSNIDPSEWSWCSFFLWYCSVLMYGYDCWYKVRVVSKDCGASPFRVRQCMKGEGTPQLCSHCTLQKMWFKWLVITLYVFGWWLTWTFSYLGITLQCWGWSALAEQGWKHWSIGELCCEQDLNLLLSSVHVDQNHVCSFGFVYPNLFIGSLHM